MRRMVMLLLVAATIMGSAACVSGPRTPAELEERAIKHQERLRQKAESRAKKRETILNSLGYAWDGYRRSPFFTRETLLELKALCHYAKKDWTREVRSLLFSRIYRFASLEVLSYFKQIRFGGADTRVVAETTIQIGNKLRALIQIGEITLQEYRDLWGEVETWARQYTQEEIFP